MAWCLYKANVEISVVVPHEDMIQSTSKFTYTTLGPIPKGHFILPQAYFLNHVHALVIVASYWKQPI